MKYRDFYSDDPLDDIWCEDCNEKTQWFTLQERPYDSNDWHMGAVLFKLACCGHIMEVFDDVIPLRGQPVGDE